jgi:hypothetical protein
LGDRLLLVRRGLSAGEGSTRKGRRHRFVPLSTPAAAPLARLTDRAEFTQPQDYVLANRFGKTARSIGAAPPLQARMRRGRTAAKPTARTPTRRQRPDRTHQRPRLRMGLSPATQSWLRPIAT